MSTNVSSPNFLELIQPEIQRVEELMRSQAAERHPDLDTALKHLLASGGKRIRPALALLTGGMFGASPQKLVTLAAAIELLHTATLVHDDLIDGAYLRRGIATLNSQWSPAATVLTGDFIFAKAAKLAAETESVLVMQLFAHTLATIVNGEITQLFFSHQKTSRENYNQRIYAKTASLFEASTASAALLSQAAPTVIEAMRAFGYHIGMAFQIVDDILDFTGEQATIGKPVASDLRQGIVTLPALYYLDANPGDPDMDLILQGNFPGEDTIARLLKAIRESGVIHRAKQDAENFIAQAKEILSEFPFNKFRQALDDLTEYIVRRDI